MAIHEIGENSFYLDACTQNYVVVFKCGCKEVVSMIDIENLHTQKQMKTYLSGIRCREHYKGEETEKIDVIIDEIGNGRIISSLYIDNDDELTTEQEEEIQRQYVADFQQQQTQQNQSSDSGDGFIEYLEKYSSMYLQGMSFDIESTGYSWLGLNRNDFIQSKNEKEKEDIKIVIVDEVSIFESRDFYEILQKLNAEKYTRINVNRDVSNVIEIKAEKVEEGKAKDGTWGALVRSEKPIKFRNMLVGGRSGGFKIPLSMDFDIKKKGGP